MQCRESVWCQKSDWLGGFPDWVYTTKDKNLKIEEQII